MKQLVIHGIGNAQAHYRLGAQARRRLPLIVTVGGEPAVSKYRAVPRSGPKHEQSEMKTADLTCPGCEHPSMEVLEFTDGRATYCPHCGHRGLDTAPGF